MRIVIFETELTLSVLANVINIFLNEIKSNLEKLIGSDSNNIKTGVLSDFVKFTSGKAKTKNELSEMCERTPIPVYGGNGINGYCAESLVTSDTVIIGRVGEYCGCVHRTNGPAWITDNAMYPGWINSRVTKNYLFLLLHALKLNNYKSRTGQPLISQKVLNDIKVSIPSDDDQNKIFDSYITEVSQFFGSMNIREC